MARMLLFVHGTGVRKEGYDASLALIQRQIKAHELSVGVAECRWGEHCGASLASRGLSVPTYGTSRAVGTMGEADGERALWHHLMQDPAYELAMLPAQARAPAVARPPNQTSPGDVLLRRWAALRQNKALKTSLTALGLSAGWPAVLAQLEGDPGFDAAKASDAAGEEAHREALARALVASLMKAALEVGAPLPDAAGRDGLVRTVSAQLGEGSRGGLGSWLATPFIGLAESIGTWKVRRERTSITDATYPAAGDILLYQAHGERIRGFIRDRLAERPDDEFYLFAHSLGGVACVELLVEGCPANVRGLVTFGSQAPFFHELDALRTLPCGHPLPPHFPRWLNFYDLNDPLSYIGAKVFPDGRVADHQVESGEDFPASHSAYLGHRPLWLQLAAHLAADA